MAPSTSSSSVAATLREAVKLHRAGKLDEAALLYNKVLAAEPEHADALHLAGVVAHQQGRHDEAVALIGRAIGQSPAVPDFHHSRGLAYRAMGDWRAAEADFEKAVALNPRYPEAWLNLGITCLQRNDASRALAAFTEAAALVPGAAEIHGYLGTARLKLGDLTGAVAALQRAAALDPNFTEAHYNLGLAHQRRGDAKAAEAAWRRAIETNPFYLKPWNNLALLLHNQGRTDEARACFERALSHAGPESREAAELWNNFANLLDDLGLVEASLDAYERAAKLAPGDARFQVNLGAALRTVGKTEAAGARFAEARRLDPADATAANCAMLGLLYAADDPQAPRRAAEAWAAGLKPSTPAPYANSRDPTRRLRLGYVSPDFCHHAVAYFIESVLAAHDQATTEIFCYAEVKSPDATTERFKQLVSAPHQDHWRDTVGLTDEALAAKIRADRIDILIDLAGHTVGARLNVFAAKPAPIQVTWIGYPATTGLPQIEWRITDAVADPPGMTEDQYTEKPLRLPGGFNCYRPPADAPEVGPLPADATGAVTFGCFNHAAKIRDAALAVWAELLKRVPNSRLLLKHRGFSLPSVVDEYRQSFARRGVPADRLTLLPPVAGTRNHLAAYNQVDIGLDPFPYNGTTTTCEALWMGVPVVTLAGAMHRARVGASLLTRLGLPELVAPSLEAYIDVAARLAEDRPRLQELRRGLRQRMAASPLCDAGALTRELEAALRQVWREWCRTAAS